MRMLCTNVQSFFPNEQLRGAKPQREPMLNVYMKQTRHEHNF